MTDAWKEVRIERKIRKSKKYKPFKDKDEEFCRWAMDNRNATLVDMANKAKELGINIPPDLWKEYKVK